MKLLKNVFIVLVNLNLYSNCNLIIYVKCTLKKKYIMLWTTILCRLIDFNVMIVKDLRGEES